MGRVLPGLAMAGGWVLLLWFASPTFFWAVFVGIGMIGLHEYYRMVLPQGGASDRFVLIAISMVPVFISGSGRADLLLAGLFLSMFFLFLITFRWFSRLDDILSFLGKGMVGILYPAFCFSHIILLFHFPDGRYWLAVLTALTIGSDTGAYYCGRQFGKRKLCPVISPGKTVEGALGGFCVATLAVLVTGLVLPLQVSAGRLVLLTVLIVPVAILGDLAESVLKRASGVKDSGAILAGHGGVLDRIDSLLMTAPALYGLLLVWKIT